MPAPFDTIAQVVAALLVLLGLAGIVLPALPGIPLMFAGMLLAAWADGFRHVGAWPLLALALMTILALLADVWAAALGARRGGASRKALWGSVLGTFAGLLFMPFGLLLGPFLGALIGELWHGREWRKATQVGFGTWLGLVAAIILKLTLAFAMLGLFAAAWWLWPSRTTMTSIDRTSALPRCALLLALAAGDAAAQSPASAAAVATVRPEACAAISGDAERLLCYDQAVGRRAASPQAADSAADQAKAELDTMPAAAGPKPARQDNGTTFFVHDDQRDAIANAGKGSLLDSRWELARDSKLGSFQLRAYKPIYLLPAFWTSQRNDFPTSLNPQDTVTESRELDNTELKFQLSFKTKVAENLFGDNGDVWVGYTQSSRWQAYNSAASRPFRETNYEPEAMLVFRSNYSLAGWRGRLFGVGLNHQSNGQSDPLSRSWNRVVFDIGLDRDNWALMLRPWYRLKEDRKDDNNPHIEDYIGRGDATLVWHKGGHEVSLMARHSLRGGDRSHGAVQLDWGFPINNLLRGHLQVFDGYGESLIDYNHRATYVGLGISLLEWY